MAVVFDAGTSTSGTSTTSLTTPSFTITSSANRAGIVGLSLRGNDAAGLSMSLGGVAGSLVANADTGTVTQRRVLIYGVTNPPSGSQTASASWTTAQTAVIGTVTASGVDQTTPLNNGQAATGTTLSGSLTITSSSGDLTVDTWVDNLLATGDPTTNQTQQWLLAPNADIHGSGATGPGTENPTHTWTLGNSANTPWGIAGVNFKAAAAAGGQSNYGTADNNLGPRALFVARFP